MKFTTLAILPALAGVGSALPVGMAKRQEVMDVDILQFALTLEHLENVFYKEALQRFSQAEFEAAGFDKHFFDNMLFIAQDEQKHVTLLEGAISAAGATPVKPCTYNFGISDINSFVTLSTVLEGVGTSAYLGGAPLLQDKDILTTAGAILVTEALHTSQQRLAIGEVPAPIDLGTPLDANSVFTLATSFIVECPADNTPLPFQANPVLTVDVSASSCPAPVGDVLFKRTSHEAMPAPAPAVHEAMPPPAQHEPMPAPAPAVHEAMPPPPPEHVMAPPPAEHAMPPPPPPPPAHDAGLVGPEVVPSHVAPPPSHEELAAAQEHANQMAAPPAHVQNLGGKVEAAKPCPFLHEGQQVTLNAEADVVAGSFVTFVSALSVVSVEAQITGSVAVATVPAGIAGQCYTFVTSRSIDDNKLAADAISFGPAIIEVQPPAPVIDFGVAK